MFGLLHEFGTEGQKKSLTPTRVKSFKGIDFEDARFDSFIDLKIFLSSQNIPQTYDSRFKSLKDKIFDIFNGKNFTILKCMKNFLISR